MLRQVFAFMLVSTSFSATARANIVTARYTWIGNDTKTLGMFSKDASSGVARWGWSTNGNVFDCLETGRDGQQVEITCPRISYRFHLYADHAIVDSPGGQGQNLGGGSWDDRRFWYSAGAPAASFVSRFNLLDNFKWQELQYTNNRQTAQFNFVETGRDAKFVYLYDASRSTSVAIGLKELWVKNTTNVPNWTKFYNGQW